MNSGAPVVLLRFRRPAFAPGLAVGIIMRLEMLHRGIGANIIPLLLLNVRVDASRAFPFIASSLAISALLEFVERFEVVAVVDRITNKLTSIRLHMLCNRSKRTIRKRLDDDLVPMLDRAGIVIDVRPIIIFIIAYNCVVSMSSTLERGL